MGDVSFSRGRLWAVGIGIGWREAVGGRNAGNLSTTLGHGDFVLAGGKIVTRRRYGDSGIFGYRFPFERTTRCSRTYRLYEVRQTRMLGSPG